MTAETDPSPATDPEEQSSSFSTWRVVLAAFLVAVVGVIVARLLLFAFAENFGFAGKSLWAYLDVFLVPVFVAAATIWLTVWENRRQRRYEAAQQELQDKADQAQKDRELEVARQHAQDAALQAYLDQMSQMLADKERPLRRSQPGDTLSLVAEVRTRTVLRRLDGKQKRHVVQFLSDAGLIQSSRMHLVMAKVEQKLEQAVQLEKEGKRDDTAET